MEVPVSLEHKAGVRFSHPQLGTLTILIDKAASSKWYLGCRAERPGDVGSIPAAATHNNFCPGRLSDRTSGSQPEKQSSILWRGMVCNFTVYRHTNKIAFADIFYWLRSWSFKPVNGVQFSVSVPFGLNVVRYRMSSRIQRFNSSTLSTLGVRLVDQDAVKLRTQIVCPIFTRLTQWQSVNLTC